MTSSAFNAQYQPLEDLLFAFAMKLTRDTVNAQDLMQETLCRAYKAKDRFKEGTNFKAWITTIMRNNYINEFRKLKTRNRVEAPVEDYGYMVENKGSQGDAGSLIMMKELTGMVDSLSEDFQKPFVMFMDGYHYDEIAAEMNIPMGTVKSRIFFARKKLKSMVQAQYGSLHALRA